MREDRRLLAALPVWANRMRSDLLMLLLDAALVSLSLMAILLIRDGGPPNPNTWRQALGFLPVVIAVFLVVGWAFGVYRHVWRYASVYEARRLIEAGTVSMAVLCVTVLATHRQFGPRTIIASSALATLLMGAVRFQSRLFSRRRVEETRGRPAGRAGRGRADRRRPRAADADQPGKRPRAGLLRRRRPPACRASRCSASRYAATRPTWPP